MFVGVPAMYRMLEEARASERDLTSVRIWASGADAMPPELAERFKKMGATVTVPVLGALGQATFAEGYGMVEVGGGVAAKVSPPFLGSGLGRFGEALGVALPGYEMRVVTENGDAAPAGQVGELQVKGPGVLKAYWGDAEATAAVLTDDGWLRTGDLGRKGPLGMVVFEGRSKHVIMHGGYSVYALEVEQTLEQHPDVLEASVVGLPDERMGEVPAAAVRLAEGATLTKARLGDWASEHLAEYKVPKRFVVVDQLPRTGTNKVQKSELLDLFAG
jgi:acyl-CoA synthetase (AMP-forming)/AMP-acid ligase II